MAFRERQGKAITLRDGVSWNADRRFEHDAVTEHFKRELGPLTSQYPLHMLFEKSCSKNGY